jgi:AraC-like DNA-binding protein
MCLFIRIRIEDKEKESKTDYIKQMVHQLYSYSLFSACVLLLFFGGSLLFGKVPRKFTGGYGRARKILGVAFYFFALEIFLQWKFEFREWNPIVASALSFTCFYLEAFLVGMSFISLLDSKYICRRRLICDMCKYVVLMALAWTAALSMKGMSAKVTMWVVAILFCVDSTRIAVIFFRTYRKVVKEVDDYYADDVMAFVRWLYKSSYGVVALGISCTVMAFAPLWAVSLYMSLGIVMFVYVYISFQNYMMYYGEVSRMINEASENDVQVAGMQMDRKSVITDVIEERLRRWKADGRYRSCGITIESLASEIGTNRAYLSAVINRDGRHTFREWVTSLRIEDAKRMLADQQSMTVADVADRCGFSSDSYFVRLFSASVGMTPAKWRENNFTPPIDN